jgi:hypothetical protein
MPVQLKEGRGSKICEMRGDGLVITGPAYEAPTTILSTSAKI